MRSKTAPAKDAPARTKPWKLLIWTTLLGLLFGVLQLGEPMEDALRVARNRAHMHPASGDIVLVQMDPKSLREVGESWPWPRRTHAKMVDMLTAADAERIFFDVNFWFKTSAEQDNALADALERSGRVVLSAHPSASNDWGVPEHTFPTPQLRSKAKVASVVAQYNYQGAAWKLPYAVKDRSGLLLSSFSADLAKFKASEPGSFRVDYSIDPKTIPTLSFSQVLAGRFDPKMVRGRTVIIGLNVEQLGDWWWVPGTGRTGGVFMHILGAETLKRGVPTDLGWVPPFLLAVLFCSLAVLRYGGWWKQVPLLLTAGLFLVGPVPLEAAGIFADVAPALFITLAIAGYSAWRQFKSKALVHPVSGLPNLTALRSTKEHAAQALVVARVLNYDEIIASLQADHERPLIEQIVGRLMLGSPSGKLHHGDDGVFAWFVDADVGYVQQCESLHTVFRSPLRVRGEPIDAVISFGVEISGSRSVSSRLSSALVAADEAAAEGLKWKIYDPTQLEAASWKLSMLGQLDAAIDNGEVWVAYQPQLELGTGRIVGVEALARWTHPNKGPVSPIEFVTAAEQHDRIGKLSYFVLEQAISASAKLSQQGTPVQVAVNVSARLLSDNGLVSRIAGLLERYDVDPELLTLELTETAALSGTGAELQRIDSLRDMGVSISIDDYGTGLSTLEYLKKVPATELKIDQSFIRAMHDNRSDRLMVQSTIALAHSLGQRVVAEGVEDLITLETLRTLKCDVAQGFAIGRPGSLAELLKRLERERKRSVA